MLSTLCIYFRDYIVYIVTSSGLPAWSLHVLPVSCVQKHALWCNCIWSYFTLWNFWKHFLFMNFMPAACCKQIGTEATKDLENAPQNTCLYHSTDEPLHWKLIMVSWLSVIVPCTGSVAQKSTVLKHSSCLAALSRLFYPFVPVLCFTLGVL